MSAIQFVVRDGAGDIQRGSVAGDGASSSIIVGSGADISLNLDQSQIVSYARQGQALEITLLDGRVIVIEGFFAPGGGAENTLHISSNGGIAEVALAEGSDGVYFASYTVPDTYGKWAPEDDLVFLRRSDIMLAESVPGDDDVGMLVNPLLGGIGGIGGGLGALGAAGAGAAIIGGIGGGGGDGDGGGSSGPSVAITSGTQSSGHVVNAEDHADGVTIGGTGTPGATVSVTVEGATEEVVVGDDGTWEVTFDPGEVLPGEYQTDVGVTITDTDGRTASVSDVLVIDTEAGLAFDASTVEGDGAVNAVEIADGVVLTGWVEAGSTVSVEIEGQAYQATVTGETWSLELPAGQLQNGEYTLDVTVSSIDAHGNTAQVSDSVIIDTETHVAFSGTPVEIDGVVNAAEAADGVVLTGSAEAGASVAVTFAGTTISTTADDSGAWSVNFPAGAILSGEYTASVSATATDAYGNTATASTSFEVDTELDVTLDPAAAAGADQVLNHVEHADGLTLTGQTEAGAAVEVAFGGLTRLTTADANGTWSVDFSTAEVPTGETSVPVAVTATDAAGNTASTSGSVEIDTFVNELTSAALVEGDDQVNAGEVLDGITLTGTVEAGSTVMVTFEGITRAANVDSAGNWSVSYAASEIPPGEYETTVTIAATDAAGNTAELTDSFIVDTVSPEAPEIESVTLTQAGIEYIGTEVSDDLTISRIDGDGTLTALQDSADGATLPWGEMLFQFDPAVPDGANLIVTETDGAGNASSTLLALEQSGTEAVSLDGLSQVDLGAIDLDYATDAELTLTAEDLVAMTGEDKTLAVHGGADDRLFMDAGAPTGSTTIGGRTYDIYTLGDGTVLVNEDIIVSPIGIT